MENGTFPIAVQYVHTNKDSCQRFQLVVCGFLIVKVYVHIQPHRSALLEHFAWEAESIVNKGFPFECATHASRHPSYCCCCYYYDFLRRLSSTVCSALHVIMSFLFSFLQLILFIILFSRECVFSSSSLSLAPYL